MKRQTGNLRYPFQTQSMTSAFAPDCERIVSYETKNTVGKYKGSSQWHYHRYFATLSLLRTVLIAVTSLHRHSTRIH